MTLTVRPAAARGHADHGWLDSYHSFSFADYHDPRHMGFRALRVINEDRVAPGRGFGSHGHRDMEIISYVLAGELAHQDSLGNGSTIRPGEIQRMSAGTGVRHSELNPSPTTPVHFLQIWIVPDRAGHAPGYEQVAIAPDELAGRLRLIASPDGAGGSVTIHQDARVYAARLAPGQTVELVVAPGRHAWLQVARGAIAVGATALAAGDGASTSTPGTLTLTGDGEVLIFDLA